MKKIVLLILTASILASHVTAESLHTFTDGDPAIAAQVNHNFDMLNNAIRELQTAREAQERTAKAWWDVNDQYQVDCTNDEAALGNAIAAGESNIFITAGTCDARPIKDATTVHITGALNQSGVKQITLDTHGELLQLKRDKTNYVLLTSVIFDGSISHAARWIRLDNVKLTGKTTDWKGTGDRAGLTLTGDGPSVILNSEINSPTNASTQSTLCDKVCYAIWQAGGSYIANSVIQTAAGASGDARGQALNAIQGANIISINSTFKATNEGNNGIGNGTGAAFPVISTSGATGYFLASDLQLPLSFGWGSTVQIVDWPIDGEQKPSTIRAAVYPVDTVPDFNVNNNSSLLVIADYLTSLDLNVTQSSTVLAFPPSSGEREYNVRISDMSYGFLPNTEGFGANVSLIIERASSVWAIGNEDQILDNPWTFYLGTGSWLRAVWLTNLNIECLDDEAAKRTRYREDYLGADYYSEGTTCIYTAPQP